MLSTTPVELTAMYPAQPILRRGVHSSSGLFSLLLHWRHCYWRVGYLHFLVLRREFSRRSWLRLSAIWLSLRLISALIWLGFLMPRLGFCFLERSTFSRGSCIPDASMKEMVEHLNYSFLWFFLACLVYRFNLRSRLVLCLWYSFTNFDWLFLSSKSRT